MLLDLDVAEGPKGGLSLFDEYSLHKAAASNHGGSAKAWICRREAFAVLELREVLANPPRRACGESISWMLRERIVSTS